jgi:hypothetical protein
MERINQNTNSVCSRIKTLLIELENNNNKIIEDNRPRVITNQERPAAGISTTILHGSEISWRGYLRNWRSYPGQ